MSLGSIPPHATARVRVQSSPTAAYIATVTVVGATQVKVTIPSISSSTAQYVALVTEGLFTAALNSVDAAAATSSGTHVTHTFGEDGSHTHGLHHHRLGIDLAVGDRVVVLPLGGDEVQWIVVARMP